MFMRPLNEVIRELRVKHGNKAQVARKLHISGVRLGQYEAGRQQPKIDFFDKWKEVFGEDIREIQKQTNGTLDKTIVSNETENPTQVDIDDMNDENPLAGDPDEIYRRIVEGNTEYLLIPRSVLQEKYRLIPMEQFQKDKDQMEKDRVEADNKNKKIDKLLDQNERLIARILLLEPQPPVVKKAKKHP